MKNRELTEEFYKNEGIAIYFKGRMIIGIHPENLESNTRALNDGTIKIDWVGIIERYKEDNK